MPKLKQIKPDHWYFAVDCSTCGEAFPIAEAPSPDKDPTPRFPTIRVGCPHCHKEHTYAGAQISRRLAESASRAPRGAHPSKSNKQK
jgi:hypothetical protein